jgi:dihydrofolate synthase/folylpolyglutamate synthase
MTEIERSAKRVGAELYCSGRDFDAFEERGRLVYQSEERLIDLPLPSLIGRNQVINAGVAIAAMLRLTDGKIPAAALEDGMRKAQWPARFSRLPNRAFQPPMPQQTELWLDGGHNPAAGVALAQTLADLQDRVPKPTYLIIGMMAQKDAEGFLTPFKGLVKGARLVPIPDETAAMPPAALLSHAAAAGLQGTTAASVPEALADIEREAPGEKRILICGSLYLAGHVLKLTGGQ